MPTLIFDEIDTGIGGRTAEAVGAKLAQVARGAQVLCVTHLAQLAYYADRHFLLEKATEAGRTISRMHALDDRRNASKNSRACTPAAASPTPSSTMSAACSRKSKGAKRDSLTTKARRHEGFPVSLAI